MTTRQALNRARVKGFLLLGMGFIGFVALTTLGAAASLWVIAPFLVFLAGIFMIMFRGSCVWCGKNVACVLGPLIQLYQMQHLIKFCPRCGKSVDLEPSTATKERTQHGR